MIDETSSPREISNELKKYRAFIRESELLIDALTKFISGAETFSSIAPEDSSKIIDAVEFRRELRESINAKEAEMKTFVNWLRRL